jgi:hypothetical protein
MHRNLYDDGLDLSADRLMRLAVNKYDTIAQRTHAEHEGESEVMALNVQVPKKEEPRAKEDIMEMIKKSVEASFTAKAPSGRAAISTRKGKLPEWKKAVPSTGEPKSKKVNGKTYHWCPRHKMWTIHSSTDCTLERTRQIRQVEQKIKNVGRKEARAMPSIIGT